MSYNDNPDWAPIDTSDLDSNKHCPRCRSDETNYVEATSFDEPDYYCAAHIPPKITLDCYNCGLSWDVELLVQIKVTNTLIDPKS